jgi:hypothetical protein
MSEKPTPQVIYSDDGILTLEWHRDGRGVCILLSEDGTFSVARREKTSGYAENTVGKGLSEACQDIRFMQEAAAQAVRGAVIEECAKVADAFERKAQSEGIVIDPYVIAEEIRALDND